MKKAHIIVWCLFTFSGACLALLTVGIIVIEFEPGVIYLYGIILFGLWFWWIFSLQMCVSIARTLAAYEETLRKVNSSPPPSMELKL